MHPSRFARLTVVRWFIPALCTSLACAGPGDRTQAVVERDSAGIRIVENPEQISDQLGWRIGETPTVEIGGNADIDSDVEGLYRVRGALRLADGTIVIANAGTHQVRFYGPDGTLRAVAGGEGEGPGEFMQLDWMGRLAPDTVLATDSRLTRVTVISPEGVVVRTTQLEKTTDVQFARVVSAFADGSFLTRGFAAFDDGMRAGVHRPMSPHYHFGPDGRYLGETGVFPGSETYFEPMSGGAVAFTTPPLNQVTRMIAGDGTFFFSDGSPTIQRHRPDGTLDLLIRRLGQVQPVTDELLAQARDERLAGTRASARGSMRETLAKIPAPNTVPSFGPMVLDREGFLWVASYPLPNATRTMWTIFSPAGHAMGTVDTRADLTWLEIGSDYALASWTDDVDVEHVGLFALTR